MSTVCIPKIVSVIPLAKLSRTCMKGYYAVVFKEKPCLPKAGCRSCDFHEGSMSFYLPEEKADKIGTDYSKNCLPCHDDESKGWALLFSPTLLSCDETRWKPEDYSFFTYYYKESLHVSCRERTKLEGMVQAIKEEAELCCDRYSCKIVAREIELLLIHCKRYYERQFQTRSEACRCTRGKLEQSADRYIAESRSAEPTRRAEEQIATEMQMSEAYLKDYIEFESGFTFGEYLQMRQMAMARKMLAEGKKSVCEIAKELGFGSTQQFRRIFQCVYGMPPTNC